MLQFAWPLVALAIVLPWLVARFAPRAAPVAAPLRVPFLHAARAWSRAGAGTRPRARVWLALAAWTALVGAACRPQWIGEPVGVPASGRSVLLALDVSASMRNTAVGSEIGLDVMRRTARAFVASRAGDRIGLIVFGSKAYVQSPLTFDLVAVAGMVDEAFIGLAGEGTALGDAIALGVARLRAMLTLFGRIAALRQRGRGIVYITHRMEEIYRLADRITVLVYGEVIASGPPDEIRGNPAVREAYLGEEVD